MSDTQTECREIWAVVFSDGRIIAESDFENEEEAWRIALGWPDQDEIDEAKKRGAFCVKARLEFQRPVTA